MKIASIHRSMTLVALLLLSASLLFAHGDQKHVMGTVSKVTGSTISVKNLQGKVVDVNVSSATQFMKGDKAAALADVKEGDRVVIHAKPDSEGLQATTVKIGTGKTARGKMAHKMGQNKHNHMKGMNMDDSTKSPASPTSPK